MIKREKLFKALVITAFAVCLTLTTALAEKADYCTIVELKAQSQDGWRQTYEAKGRTITVDVPIHVPDVAACPMLTIRRAALPDEAAAQAYTAQQRLTEIGSWAGTMGEPDAPPRQSTWKTAQTFANGAIPDVTPDNSELTFAQAWKIMGDACQRLTGVGTESFALQSATVYSRTYRYQIKNDERVWGKAVTEKGFYDIWAKQLLHGIAITRGPEYTHYLHGIRMPMYGQCGANVIDEQRYLLTLQLVEETSVVQEDVPLLPFAKVRSWLEQKIADGLIREISDVELQYIGFFDPDDASVNYAVPVWHVRAVHATDAKREYEGLHIDKLGDIVEDRPWEDMYFPAQTGEYLDPDSTARNRRDVPTILTWDDVR